MSVLLNVIRTLAGGAGHRVLVRGAVLNVCYRCPADVVVRGEPRKTLS